MYRYKILEDIKLVYVKAVKKLVYKDLIDHIEKLSQDPRYVPPMLKLLDYTELKQYNVSTEESASFSRTKQSLADRFINEKCAITVHSNLVFGMARHHQAFLDEEKLQTKIFWDLNEAKSWLGISPDYHFSV